MDRAIGKAVELFKYREAVLRRKLPCDPDWERVVTDNYPLALSGELGETDQQQCAIQGIKLALFERGAVQKPWTKAFVAMPPPPLPWHQRWWNKIKSLLSRLRDLL